MPLKRDTRAKAVWSPPGTEHADFQCYLILSLCSGSLSTRGNSENASDVLWSHNLSYGLSNPPVGLFGYGVFSPVKARALGPGLDPAHCTFASFPTASCQWPSFAVEHQQAQLLHPWASVQPELDRIFGPMTLARRTGYPLLMHRSGSVRGGEWGHKREGDI